MTSHPAASVLRLRWGRTGTWSDNEGGFISVLVVVTVLVFCLVPIVQLIGAASRVLQSGTAEAVALLTSPAVARATLNTFAIASGSTALAVIVGSFVALALATMALKTKRVLAFLFVLSLMVAPQVTALAFKTLAGPSSPILNSLGLAPPLEHFEFIPAHIRKRRSSWRIRLA